MKAKKRRPSPKVSRVDVELYGFSVLVVIHPDLKEFNRWMRKNVDESYYPEDADGSRPLGRCCSRGGSSVIWLPSIPTTPDQLGTLAHEISHAVFNAFELIGIESGYRNDEPFCYALKYIMAESLKKLRK